jgi:hypothetical protein
MTLLVALEQTYNARTYRFESQVFYSNPSREIMVSDSSGERSGNIRHMFMGGLPGELLTGDPNRRAEMIVVGSKTYVLGPLPLVKANEAKWYILSDDTTSKSTKPGDVLSPEVMAYNKIGSETVDGKACDIYTVDKDAARQALVASGAITQQQMDNVVNVEVTYWFCGDGYVRRARLRVDEKSLSDPSTTDIVRIENHYFDFDAPIQLAAPTDAIELPK